MKNLLQLFARYGALILFLFLEFICFFLIINYNDGQKAIFAHSSNLLSGKVYEIKSSWGDFFELDEINDKLNQKNALLVQQLIDERGYGEAPYYPDSSQYELLPARVCNQSLYATHNHLTLCAGSVDGIQKGMGVISDEGIVGIVQNVSEHYAHVISILNADSRVSVNIKNKNSFGNLVWKGRDIQKATLEAIPKHEVVSVGDTIVTNGYSTVFPADLMVGLIDDFLVKEGSSSYTISVDLSSKLSSLKYVYVINNRFKKEQIALENGE